MMLGRTSRRDFLKTTAASGALAGLGDLDRCNGRTGVTPEFPNGIYYYVITSTFPFVHRCLRGSTSTGG